MVMAGPLGAVRTGLTASRGDCCAGRFLVEPHWTIYVGIELVFAPITLSLFPTPRTCAEGSTAYSVSAASAVIC